MLIGNLSHPDVSYLSQTITELSKLTISIEFKTFQRMYRVPQDTPRLLHRYVSAGDRRQLNTKMHAVVISERTRGPRLGGAAEGASLFWQPFCPSGW